MSKKIIFISIIIIVILIAGFFIFKTIKNKEELNTSNEQNIQNVENTQNNDTVQNTSTYDGNGYEEQNMVSKTLIAKDVDSISVSQDEMHLGEVIIKGGTPVNQDMGWIVFE